MSCSTQGERCVDRSPKREPGSNGGWQAKASTGEYGRDGARMKDPSTDNEFAKGVIYMIMGYLDGDSKQAR